MTKELRFITIEGIDGCGKTTLAGALHKFFTNIGKKSLITREPGGSNDDFSKRIRSLLLCPNLDTDHMSELLLFVADRVHHIHSVIVPAIVDGNIVICDRYNDSTISYQGHGCGLGVLKVKRILELSGCMSLVPDYTLIIDIDLSKSLSRCEGDRLEKRGEDFFKKVRNGFHEIAKEEPERCCLLDGNMSQEELAMEAINKLNSLS